MVIKATYMPVTHGDEGEKPDPERAEKATIVAFDLDGNAIYVSDTGFLRRATISRFSECQLVTL